MGNHCYLESQSAIEKKSCYHCCYYLSLYIILILFILILCICIVYVFVCVCTGIIRCICECRCPQRQEEGVESPGPRFIGGFELSNVGAGNWTCVLLQNQLSRPCLYFRKNTVYLVCCREHSRYGIAGDPPPHARKASKWCIHIKFFVAPAGLKLTLGQGWCLTPDLPASSS